MALVIREARDKGRARIPPVQVASSRVVEVMGVMGRRAGAAQPGAAVISS